MNVHLRVVVVLIEIEFTIYLLPELIFAAAADGLDDLLEGDIIGDRP